MKKLVLTLLALVAAQAAQAAVSISVTSLAESPLGPKFATSDGNLLPVGSVIRYGSFNTSGGMLR
ncbi:MAG: hypothetical protein IPK32_06845 [Verrucomicrobiaceae bacterium]|nr:hypothetical protein [Verrucomicrobiaceae bacterium]